MKIAIIHFNWWSTAENGEDYFVYTVGVETRGMTPERIEEHQPCGEGDKWYYDVHFTDGTMQRIFNPNRVFYEKEII